MKAVQIHQYGGTEQLVYEEAPMPELRPDDVLVKVVASGVNPVDWKVREGYMKEQIIRDFPVILGWDMAGIVEEVGDQVTGFKKGDEVYGRPDLNRNGTYAEYVAVRAAALSFKPTTVDFVSAAAVPLAALTAWQGIFDHGELKAGQKLLVTGAAGGVGSYAVQFARWKGAFVYGTASKENNEYLHGLGADKVIDYHEKDFEDRVKDIDVVLDTIGGDEQKKLLNMMRPGSIIVSTVGFADQAAIKARGLRSAGFMAASIPAQLLQIASLVDEGKIRVTVSKVFPLQEAAAAHQLGEEGHTQGKIVLKIVD